MLYVIMQAVGVLEQAHSALQDLYAQQRAGLDAEQRAEVNRTP